MMTETARSCVLKELAARIDLISESGPIRVAIDGRTASGKTTFADALATAVADLGRPIIRSSIDGFHRPKTERYARGRYSPEGYYFDARDLAAIRRLLLDPLGPDGSRLYRTASFDLEADHPIEVSPSIAPLEAVLIVDGTFLQRPELAAGWDAVIFLRVSEEETVRRGIQRDSDLLGGLEAATALYSKRYVPAENIYAALAHPEQAADAIVDNEDFDHPVLTLKADGRFCA